MSTWVLVAGILTYLISAGIIGTFAYKDLAHEWRARTIRVEQVVWASVAALVPAINTGLVIFVTLLWLLSTALEWVHKKLNVPLLSKTKE